MSADDTARTFGLERIGREIHLTTLGGPRDGATLCGKAPTRRRHRGSIRGTCPKCAGWSRTIQTLATISREAQTTPYDVEQDGL
jgi:hypothetical protein